MNAMLATEIQLPSILSAPPSPSAPRRRQRIAAFTPDARQLDRFNVLLHGLGRQQAPLETDQLITAAREVCGHRGAGSPPACIAHQLRRAAALRLMTSDAGWTAANDTLGVANVVMEYLRSREDLIPDRLPDIGRFDDAIVVETAWPRLDAEVARYLDFCRVRALETSLRGEADADFRFTREDWEQARHAEAALAAKRRQIRESSYLPAPVPMFYVH